MASGVQGKRARELYDRTVQNIELLRQLSNVLSKTTDAWDAFNRTYIGFFSENGTSQTPSTHCLQSLLAINKAFDELRRAQQTLEHLTDACEHLARKVS